VDGHGSHQLKGHNAPRISLFGFIYRADSARPNQVQDSELTYVLTLSVV